MIDLGISKMALIGAVALIVILRDRRHYPALFRAGLKG